MFLNTSLNKCGKTYDDYKAFLDHPKFLLALASQHHGFAHAKLFSLPLGVRPGSAVLILSVILSHNTTESQAAAMEKKGKLVIVNNSGWWYRARVNDYFKTAFNESNSYSFKKGQTSTKTPKERNIEYITEISQSKFVICPPGIGYDTYRMWEVITSGGVAVVESSPGLDKLYSLLPVLVVHDLLKLTPSFLESVYDCFAAHAGKWRYEMLTQQYWDSAIVKVLSSGSIEHLTRDHPDKNPYCWFYEESKIL